MKFARMFENDPLFDQVMEDIQTYRRELDLDRPEKPSRVGRLS